VYEKPSSLMNPDFVNGLIVVAYLFFGTLSIAVVIGWALKRFGLAK
jgi:hypothetical protein